MIEKKQDEIYKFIAVLLVGVIKITNNVLCGSIKPR